jgi:GT2 family glycosyltransferase
MKIEGFDEKFMEGFWFDDDDFFLRLWKEGLNFIFNDEIHGIHLDHERPDLETEEGKKKIQINGNYMMKKHGSPHVWNSLPRLVHRSPGETIWRHL